VVKSRNRRYERIGERHWTKIVKWGLLAFVILIFIPVIVFIIPQKDAYFGVVSVSEPIEIYWWSGEENKFSIIRIPSEVLSEVDNRYDQYTLKSLWKLDRMEQGRPLILNRILSLTFRLPLKWYIDRQMPEDTANKGMKFPFSFNSGITLFSQNTTNMPLPLYLSFLWKKLFSNRQSTKIYILTAADFYDVHTLGDGRTVRYLNTDSIDSALSHDFEIISLRNDNLRIALFNASEIPGLGERFAKILDRIGIYVDTVSNRSAIPYPCVLSGNEKSLNSETAGIISDMFDCRRIVSREETPYDLEISVGSGVFPFTAY
jgi:hypothetical protein